MVKYQDTKLGTIKISDETIIAYAVEETLKTKGVSSFGGGLSETLTKNILGIDSNPKGIKLSRSDEGITLDIYIRVLYHESIPQVAWDIQTNVKKKIEETTGLKVLAVNIHVQGVELSPREDEKNDKN